MPRETARNFEELSAYSEPESYLFRTVTEYMFDGDGRPFPVHRSIPVKYWLTPQVPGYLPLASWDPNDDTHLRRFCDALERLCR